MKLGVMIEGQEQVTWDVWKRVAELTERLGFDGLWRSDHIRGLAGADEDHDVVECWTALAYLAATTERILFGPLVSPMTFRQPSVLAMQAAAVADLSGGRLVLGLGAGWNVGEHEAFGIALPPLKERMDRFEEGVELIHRLFTQRHASFQGRYYTLRDAYLSPNSAAVRNTPFLIGGAGEKRTLRIAAQYADEWNGTQMTPERFRQKSAVLDDWCARVGRDPGQIARSAMMGLVIGETDAEIREHMRRIQAIWPAQRERDPLARPDELRDIGWLVGRPEQIVAQIKAMEAAGCQRIMAQHLAPGYDPALELYGSQVLPAVA